MIESDSEAIQFSAQVTESLKNKVKEHNQKYPSKKVTLSQLKKVYRRGAGAFSSSHRPGKTRGQWAMARVNSMLTGGKADPDLQPQARAAAAIQITAALPNKITAALPYKALPPSHTRRTKR